MARVGTIFKKELTDVLRDKRTILTMVVVPLVLVPLLLTIVIKVTLRQQARAEQKEITIAFLGEEYAPGLYNRFVADSQFTIVEQVAERDIESKIREEELDGAVIVPLTFPERVAADEQASVIIYFRSSSSFNVTERRITEIIEAYDEEIVGSRIRRLELDENLFDAIGVEQQDVATLKEVLGKTVGGVLPYIFIIFMFTGAMYPGIDLGAGEKERGTLETLLSSPATRLEIVMGKFTVVALAALASGLVAILGLYLGLRSVADLPADAVAVVWEILNVKVIAMIASLLVPLAAFFAATILAVSIHAKSFKEAQSSLTPLSIVIVVPVVLGLLPGIELNVQTALIPILNVSLATKEVIAGTVEPLHLIIAYLSLFVLAALSIWFCAAWFNREETLFRT